MKSVHLFIFIFILTFMGCASTPNTIVPELQFGWVLLSASDGNRIIIPNAEVIPAYNIYSMSSIDSSFVFKAKVNRPIFPMRFQPTPYGIEWADEGNMKPTKYKVVGLKDNGQEWFEVKLEYRIPREKTESGIGQKH